MSGASMIAANFYPKGVPMKRIVCGAFLLLAAACGGPSLVCQTTACSTGSKTYQTCDQADGSIEYKYGGASCSCSATSSTGCNDCATKIASYCG